MLLSRRRTAITIAGVGVLLLGLSASAIASGSGERDDVYTACLTNSGDLISVAVGKEPEKPCRGKSVQVSWNETGPQGDRGEPGDKGDKGDKGDTGETGSQGPIGPQGQSLEFDWSGTELGVRLEDEADFSYTDLRGPRGEKGDRGDTGEPGQQGDKGDQGESGEQGEKGDKGDQGERGPAGSLDGESCQYAEPKSLPDDDGGKGGTSGDDEPEPRTIHGFTTLRFDTDGDGHIHCVPPRLNVEVTSTGTTTRTVTPTINDERLGGCSTATSTVCTYSVQPGDNVVLEVSVTETGSTLDWVFSWTGECEGVGGSKDDPTCEFTIGNQPETEAGITNSSRF